MNGDKEGEMDREERGQGIERREGKEWGDKRRKTGREGGGKEDRDGQGKSAGWGQKTREGEKGGFKCSEVCLNYRL